MSKIKKRIALFTVVIALVLVSVSVYGIMSSNTPKEPGNQATTTDTGKTPSQAGDNDNNSNGGIDTGSAVTQNDNTSVDNDGTTPSTSDNGSGTGTDNGSGSGTDNGSGDGSGGGGGVAPLDFLNIALSPAGSMIATPSSPVFILTFDRGLTENWEANKNCFKIYMDGTTTNVLDSSAVTMIDKNNIQLSPTGLVAGASYNIVVSASLQANNGNTLGTAVTKSFRVASAGGEIAAPNYVSAEVTTSGDISMTFDKNMESTTELTGKYTQFTVMVNGTPATLTGIQRTSDPTKVKLTLQTKAAVGDVITVQYTKGTVKAEDGGVLENFGPSSVTNTLVAEPPIFSSATTGRNNDRVTVSFNKTMSDPSGQQAAFAVTAGGSPIVVTSAALNADPTKIDLILSTPITTNGEVTVAYTKGSVTSADGGILETFTAQAVTNQHGSAPNFISSEVTTQGDVSMTFDKNMETTTNLTGKYTQFTVMVNGTPASLTGIQRTSDPTKVKLTLQTKAAVGDVITVQYTKGTVKAEDGGVLDSFGPSSVTNTLITAAPLVSGAVTGRNNDRVTVSFNKAMADPSGQQAAFAVTVGSSPVVVTSAALNLDPTKIDLILSTPITSNGEVTVAYTKGSVTSSDGGILETFTAQAVTNQYGSAPNFISSEVTTQGDVSMTFDKNMETTTNLTGKYTQFTVMVNGTPASLTGIQRTSDPTKVKLVLKIKAVAGDVITVQYTKGTLKAEDGGVLENFGPSSVTNTLVPAAPLVSGAVTGSNNDRVTVSFNKAMADPSGQQAAFAVTVGGSPIVVTSAALNADPTKIDLILSTPITTNGEVTVAYTKGSVTSADGGILETFTAQAVTNQYGSAPNFISSEVTSQGDVSITFDKNMETTTALTGKYTQFTVMVNGTPASLTGIQRTTTPTKIKLVLKIKAVAGDVITVQYTKGTVKAEDGGVLESFGPSSVTNALI